jgi:hypothetical protein
MDDTYEHKIGHTGFEPETIYAKMVALGNRVPDLCNVNLHNQEAVLENHILQCLARIVYGSNIIGRAGTSSSITSKLLHSGYFVKRKWPRRLGKSKRNFSS